MTQLVKTAALFLAFAAHASTEITVSEANNLLDTVLGTHFMVLVKRNPHLYPAATIPSFRFTVPSTSIFNRAFEGNITDAAFNGWLTEIHRRGDCTPLQRDGDWTIDCALDFSRIYATLVAHTRGDSLLNTKSIVNFIVRVREAVGHIEITSNSAGKGVLRSLAVDHIIVDLHYADEYDEFELNSERARMFTEVMEEYFKRQLYRVLYGPFKDVLSDAIEHTEFPRVSHSNPYGHFGSRY